MKGQAGVLARLKIIPSAPYRKTVPWAGLVISVMLGLFYYWFAIANRYVVFLYEHLGAGPLQEPNYSRHWMAGLVASGALLCVYALVGWCYRSVVIAFHKTDHLPFWQHVWLLSAPPVAIGIWAITTRCNFPTLPWPLSARCIIATWIGMALALWLADLIVQQTSEALWVILHGAGMVPILLLLRAVELPFYGLASPAPACLLGTAGLVAGVLWMAGMARWRLVWRRPPLSPFSIFCAGLGLSYVVLPFAHYLFLTPPGIRYISTAGNFFAMSPVVQWMCWGIGALAVFAINKK
jgi:hypothetical protein